MFQLLPCSICQRTFSLRKEVPEDALLKCPNCGNQFRLGDVLDAFYSPWVVLDDAPSSDVVKEKPIGAPTDSVLSFDNLLQTHTDPQTQSPSNRENAVTDDVAELAADDVFNSGDALMADDLELEDLQDAGVEIESAVDTNLDDQSATDRTAYRSLVVDGRSNDSPVKKPRARQGDKGGFWWIIQVVLGGAAAIPVTLLLLWYVIGKDIANAGPTVAQYAPWIVPQKFRNAEERLPARTGPQVPPPALGEGGFRNFDEELGKKSADSPIESPDDKGTELAVSAPGKSDTEASAADSDMARAIAKVNSVKKKINQWDPKSPDRAAVLSSIFDETLEISEHLSSLPRDGTAMRLLKNDLSDAGRFFATKDVRFDFAKLQAGQFGEQTPAHSGRVYLGYAKELEETESQWVITGPDNGVKIEVSKKEVASLPPRQAFFCIGSIIDQSTETTETTETGAPKTVRISASFFQPF